MSEVISDMKNTFSVVVFMPIAISLTFYFGKYSDHLVRVDDQLFISICSCFSFIIFGIKT